MFTSRLLATVTYPRLTSGQASFVRQDKITSNDRSKIFADFFWDRGRSQLHKTQDLPPVSSQVKRYLAGNPTAQI
jgi:hypothetical protein